MKNATQTFQQMSRMIYRQVRVVTLLCLILLSSLTSSAAYAATYYVDAVNGSDRYTGLDTIHAWETTTKAANTAVAGDTVLFMPGTYANPLKPVNSGTSGHMITFKAQTRRMAIINGNLASSNGVDLTKRSYIRIEGFEITGWNWEKMYFVDSDHLEIVDNYIHGAGDTGIKGHYTTINTNILIEGNELYNLGERGIHVTGNGIIIRNNIIHHNENDGINGGGDNWLVEGNLLYDSFQTDKHQDGMDFGKLSNSTIRNNVLYDYTQLIYFSLINEPNQTYTNVDIYGNILYNDRYWTVQGSVCPGISIRAIGNRGYHQIVKNIKIHSNTFGWLGMGAIAIENSDATATFDGFESYDNIFYGDAGYVSATYPVTNVVSNYNLFNVGVSKPSFEGANSITADPGFVNYQAHSAWNFHLKTNSPAINAGNPSLGSVVTLPSPCLDIDGTSRPIGGFDIGAYEYITSAPPGNHAPVLGSIGNKSVNENSTLSFAVSAADADGDKITYSATGLPSSAAFSGQSFNWTPSYSQAGSYQVTFIARDGQAQDSETITITVGNINRPPVLASIGNKSVDENSTLSFSVSASDPDGDKITYSATGLPSGVAFSGQSFNWTPSYSQAGSYQVTFIARDNSQAQASEKITVTVNNVDRAPILKTIGNKSVYVKNILTFTVSATDPDGDTIAYSVQGLPSGATFTNQRFSWTPTLKQADSYRMTFIASDGQLQDSQTITVTVYAVDTSAPTVTSFYPAKGSIQVPLNSLITLHILDAGAGVDANSVLIKVNNNTVYSGNIADYNSAYGNCHRTGTEADYTFIYQSGEVFNFDRTVNITVNAADLAGNVMDTYSYSFNTEMWSFGKNKKVNSGSDKRDKGNPVTVTDSNSNIWVAWDAGSVGSRDIYIGKLTAGDDDFGTSIKLTNSIADHYNPAIAVGKDDKLYLVWQDNRTGKWNIYISTSTDGIIWSAERKVTDSDSNQMNPAIVADSAYPSHTYIVWQDDQAGNQDIYIASSNNSFATKTVSRITYANSDQTEPAIAADSNNTVYVVWTDSRNGASDIYGAASNKGPWTNIPIVNKPGNQSNPAIATETNGTILHFLWVDDTAGNKDIYYAASDGMPTSPLVGRNIVDDSSGADQLQPVIVTTDSTGANSKIFACWHDKRNVTGASKDTDLYLIEINSSSEINVCVGDDTANSNQSKPAIGIDGCGYPYLVWVDDRNTNTDIYYAGSTAATPNVVASKDVFISSGATVGTEPSDIKSADDVSVVIPPGAYPCDINVTISKVRNPSRLSVEYLSLLYDFGPSGTYFIKPVTVTIPYEASTANNLTSVYWYNPLTGSQTQQGISNIEIIKISPTLRALRFKTTHFTQFFVGGTSTGGSSGGGCSMSGYGQGNIMDFMLPYIGLAIVMVILKIRDARKIKSTTI